MSAVFHGTLAQHLEFGHTLEICGKALPKAKWFLIKLAAEKAEVNLQILVDLQNKAILLKQNVYSNRENTKHEYKTDLFTEKFKINITFAPKDIHFGINNKPFSVIKFDVDRNQLKTIRIVGHLEYIKQVDHRRYFPQTWPPTQILEDRLHFSNDQPMSFEAGHVMAIKAKLFGNPNGRFIIHLRNAWDNQRQELHVSVRFDSKVIVRNSKIWERRGIDATYLEFGNGERCGGFPFDDFHKPFKLAIAFTETEFKLAKDGWFFCKYVYRTPDVLSDIVGVKIFGIDGVTVRVSDLDHIKLNDPLCLGFERYSL